MASLNQFKLAAVTAGIAILSLTSCKHNDVENSTPIKERKVVGIELSEEGGIYIDQYKSSHVRRYAVDAEGDSAFYVADALKDENGEPTEFHYLDAPDKNGFKIEGELKDKVEKVASIAETAEGQQQLLETRSISDSLMMKAPSPPPDPSSPTTKFIGTR